MRKKIIYISKWIVSLKGFQIEIWQALRKNLINCKSCLIELSCCSFLFYVALLSIPSSLHNFFHVFFLFNPIFIPRLDFSRGKKTERKCSSNVNSNANGEYVTPVCNCLLKCNPCCFLLQYNIFGRLPLWSTVQLW